MLTSFDIHCLVPDLPTPEEVSPFLKEMHNNRWYTNFGPLTRQFEAEMADFLGGMNGVSVHTGTFSSATTGLELVLRVLGLPAGSRVLMPVLTFPATALAVINAGLTPVFADVDADTWELTVSTAEAAHADKPISAVMPVTAFGRPVEMAAWKAFQEKTGVKVVVDAAASLGQQMVDPDVITVFSLHATKPFGVGEGGLVVTGDKEVIQNSQSLSNFGFWGPAGKVRQIGTNAKFGEYYAAVGLAQIRRWDEVVGKRKKVARLYQKALEPLMGNLTLQANADAFVPAVFPIFSEGNRVAIMDAMAEAAIQTRHWYLPLLNEHPALEHCEVWGNINTATYLDGGLVGLPFHAFLNESDVNRVCRVLENVVS